MRITLNLPSNQEHEVREEARHQGVSVDELVNNFIRYSIFLDHRDRIEPHSAFNDRIAVVSRKRRYKVSYISFTHPATTRSR